MSAMVAFIQSTCHDSLYIEIVNPSTGKIETIRENHAISFFGSERLTLEDRLQRYHQATLVQYPEWRIALDQAWATKKRLGYQDYERV